jgi:hypothetical protein
MESKRSLEGAAYVNRYNRWIHESNPGGAERGDQEARNDSAKQNKYKRRRVDVE